MSALAKLDRALSYLEGMDGVHADAIKARAELAAVLSAGNRVVLAFAAHGRSAGALTDRRTRRECEDAMLALDTAIRATGAK